MTPLKNFLADLLGTPPAPPDERVADLEAQLTQSRRETELADAATGRWRKHCEKAREYAQSQEQLAVDRLMLLDRARAAMRELQAQIENLTTQLRASEQELRRLGPPTPGMAVYPDTTQQPVVWFPDPEPAPERIVIGRDGDL